MKQRDHHAAPLLLPLPLAGRGSGEGPLHKRSLQTQNSWRGPSPGMSAKDALIPTSPRKRGEVKEAAPYRANTYSMEAGAMFLISGASP